VGARSRAPPLQHPRDRAGQREAGRDAERRASGAPIPTPASKNAVKAPIAAPRPASSTRRTTSSASDGKISDVPAPMTSAPPSATAMLGATATSASPAACASAAKKALRRGPMRSGRRPRKRRVTTTEAANAVKTSAPLPIPWASRCRTTKPAMVP
jgi:hypothetical protein